MATTNMSLSLPTVSVTAGPTYATQINSAFETIDLHDHTSGKGVQIPTSGLNINATLQFNDNGASELTFAAFTAGSAPSSTKAVYVSSSNNDLYYRDGSGNNIRLTSGGSIATPAGSAAISYTAIGASDSPYAVANPSDYSVLFGVDTGTAVTFTLPAASTGDFAFSIKDRTGTASTNNITITPNGSDSIETGSAGASFTMNEDYGSRTFVSDGASKWYVI